MKKFLSLTFAAIIFFVASPVVHANPYINIEARVEFRPEENQLDIVANFINTGDKAADVQGISIFFINVYDGSGNVIFASKMMKTNDKYFPKFHIEPKQTVENVRLTFYNVSGSYCGDMLANPANYSEYSYPIDWDWELRYY
ncbi:MAG: hypothetical protein IKE46_01505 [Selenomonadaceae bacterium]|nr:hypothetical protein [Selenomonadaceae bacterium]